MRKTDQTNEGGAPRIDDYLVRAAVYGRMVPNRRWTFLFQTSLATTTTTTTENANPTKTKQPEEKRNRCRSIKDAALLRKTREIRDGHFVTSVP